MALAIFGISNGGLNLVVNLLILMLVVVWLALIVYTYFDARRRISDPFLVGCATLASFIPYLGTAVYAIVRPPEFLEDAHERELEIEAAELRVRQLKEASCPGCGFPVERNYLLCPYCETALGEGEPRRKRAPEGRKRPAPEERKAPKRKPQRARPAPPAAEPEAAHPAAEKADAEKRPQRSPSREPDPDPRKA